MALSAESIIAIIAAIAALVTAIVAFWKAWTAAGVARSAASTDEVEKLRMVIQTLGEAYDRQKKEAMALRNRLETLEADYKRLKQQYEDVLVWAEPRGYIPPTAGASW